jgi:hypothetical protein
MAVLAFKGIIPPRIIKTKFYQKPSCNHCIYHKEGKCTLFISLNKEYQVINADIEMIRARDNLCGPDAKLFKPK